MSLTEVRQISGESMLDILHATNTYAFSPSPPLRDADEWKEIVRQRQGVDYFALFEGDMAVSNAATTEMTQMVRGKILAAGGVWGVATRPGARRKGYCREVMRALLESEYEKHRAVSLLYPFRGSFYERLGYVTFPVSRIAKFPPQHVAGLLKKDFEGEVRLRTIAEAYDDMDQYFSRIQQKTHGMARFVYPTKARSVKLNNWWIAEAVVDGRVAGVMAYDLRGEEIMKFKFRAFRFYYENVQARCLLLQWIAQHIDQAGAVEIWLPPFEFPETWLADLRPELEPGFIAPMGRVVRVEELAGMETGPGRFTIRYHDRLLPENDGVWTFDGGSGRLEVSRTGKPTEDVLRVEGLSAAVYGTHSPDAFQPLGWGEISADTETRIRSVFPARIPHLHEMF